MTSCARPQPVRSRQRILLAALAAGLALAPAAGAVAAPVAHPTATTEAATAITVGGAVLNGAVNPGGAATKYFFQYGPTASYGRATAIAQLAAGSGAATVRATIAGLAPATRYHYRLVAENTAGAALGADAALTTRAAVVARPTVRTGAATGVTAASATLNGTVVAGGAAAKYFFQYGATTSYGRSTAPATLAAGGGAVAVRATISGLAPLTRYHYRLVAENSAGAALGADAALVTQAAPPPPAGPARPAVRTGAATSVGYQSADLNGLVYPAGQPATYFFQFGTTAGYGQSTAPAPLAAGRRTVAVRSVAVGLLPVTRYHYRLVAVNATGTAVGADASFTTRALPLSLAISALPDPVTFGAPLSIVGALSGTGAAGRPVMLQQNPFPFAGFQNTGNAQVATANGGFRFNLLSLAVTTRFRVVSVGPGPAAVSPTVTEAVRLAVTLHVRSRHTNRGYYSVRFSGRISPSQAGARVSVQRLVGGTWRRIATTRSRAASPASSRYARTLHLHHGGFYRVTVRPIDGAHVRGFSATTLVHAG